MAPKGLKIVDETKIQYGIRLLSAPTPERPSLRNAAIAAGCNKSTLWDRWKQKHQPRGEAIRQKSLLTAAEEKALVEYIILQDDWCQPPTYQQIADRALEIVRLREPATSKIGKTWVKRFIKRHPRIRGRLSSQLDRDRAKADDVTIICDFSINTMTSLLDTEYAHATSEILTRRV